MLAKKSVARSGFGEKGAHRAVPRFSAIVKDWKRRFRNTNPDAIRRGLNQAAHGEARIKPTSPLSSCYTFVAGAMAGAGWVCAGLTSRLRAGAGTALGEVAGAGVTVLSVMVWSLSKSRQRKPLLSKWA